MGTIEHPLNDSKGCGWVMRVPAVGLVADDPEEAFRMGCEVAAITHGHPSGYYSAGCLAAILCHLRRGESLPAAPGETLQLLTNGNPGHEECARAIEGAVSLWRERPAASLPSHDVARLGAGWVGEEALAISLYCALQAVGDFSRGVLLAVNHSGDSDSTGAITGNVLGLMLGAGAIPRTWLDELELRTEVEAIARDLHTRFDESDAWCDRYPGLVTVTPCYRLASAKSTPSSPRPSTQVLSGIRCCCA